MATDFLRMVQGFQRRDVVLEAEVKYLEKMQQEAQIRVVNPPSKKTYTLVCDEGEHMGGDDAAPPPLAFFLGGSFRLKPRETDWVMVKEGSLAVEDVRSYKKGKI